MKKMLNITYHQGNATESHSGIQPHTYRNGCNKNRTITNVDKDMEKLESSYVAGRNVK